MAQSPDKNASWCPLPWKGLNIRNNGDYRVCCNANVSAGKGLLSDSQGKFHNAKSSTLEQVRNSPLLNELRLSMLRGERHETCRRCNVEDDSGVSSRRIYEREFWANELTLENAIENTHADGRIDVTQIAVGYLDVRFGNLCNLKCRMCGPTDSSFWYKEHFATVGERFRDSSGKVTLEQHQGRVRVQGDDPYAWHESEFFWQQLESNIHSIRKIYCVGGEPLLIERHFEMLHKLVRAGVAEKVILEYNSNITSLPSKAFALWRHFKEVRIGASIDGYGPVNDYIRHPSRWSTIERNLDVLDNIEGNLRVWITTTVQIYNIFYLPELLKWKIAKNFKRIGMNRTAPFIKAHPLHSPKHFHIQALPHALKLKVASKFDDFYNGWFLENVKDIEPRFGPRDHLEERMRSLLDGYKNLMFKEDLSVHLPEFLAATARMDLARNENWREVLPEIAGPIEWVLSELSAGQIERA